MMREEEVLGKLIGADGLGRFLGLETGPLEFCRELGEALATGSLARLLSDL